MLINSAKTQRENTRTSEQSRTLLILQAPFPSALPLCVAVANLTNQSRARGAKRNSILLNGKHGKTTSKWGKCGRRGREAGRKFEKESFAGNNLLAKAIITTTINVELLFRAK